LTEQFFETVLRHHTGDPRRSSQQPGLKRRDFNFRQMNVLTGARCRLTARREGVHDDHSAAGIVTDAVRYIAEQKLLPSLHAGIADHENIDSFLLGGADDRGSRIGIHHD
jgi:hypothetical protein